MDADDPPDFDMHGANAIAAMTPEERAELEERFWAKTEARPDPWDRDAPRETWCLLWTGGRSGRGCEYGSFKVRGVSVGAHRVAYVLAHGPIPKGMMVRHLCHERGCLQGDHLTVGTAADNARDTKEAGRTPQGERASRPKMSAEDDRLAYELRKTDWSEASVADDFDVDPKTVRAAIKRHAKQLAAASPEATPEPPGAGRTEEGETGEG